MFAQKSSEIDIKPISQTFKNPIQTSLLERYGFYVLIICALILSYYPVLIGYYLHTDDYFWSKWGGFASNDVMRFMSIVGRPLTGLLYSASIFIKKLSWMNGVRFLSVCNLCVAAILVFQWLRLHNVNHWVSCFLSIAVFTLPPFQIYTAYLSTAPFGISLMLSILALLLVDRAVRSDHRLKLWTYSIGTLLIILAFSLYQPGACFYLTLLAVPLIMETNFASFKFLRKMCIYLAVFSLAAGLYYLIWRLWLGWADIPSVGKYDGRIFVVDLAARWKWFVEKPLLEASNFWNIFPSQAVSFSFLGFMFSALLYRFIDRKNVLFGCIRVLLLLFLIPASYCVVLASSSPSTEYRTYSALSASLLFLAFLPLASFKNIKFLIFASLFLMILGIYYSQVTVKKYFVVPDSAELNYVIQSIRDYQMTYGTNFSSINLVIMNQSVHPLQVQRNEIAQPNTMHGPNIAPVVRTALSVLGMEKDVPIFFSFKGSNEWMQHSRSFDRGMGLPVQIVPPQENSIIIDMNQWKP